VVKSIPRDGNLSASILLSRFGAEWQATGVSVGLNFSSESLSETIPCVGFIDGSGLGAILAVLKLLGKHALPSKDSI
jgi:hypothetical protein